MALQDQIVPISLGNGIDTKSDSKTVRAKVLQLIDAVFTNPGEIEKRNGYTLINNSIEGGGTITNPLMTKAYNSELICADGSNLYSFSQNANYWVPKGPYQSVSVTEKQVSTNYTGVQFPTMAATSQYTISTYYVLGGLGGTAGVYASVMDNSTQTFLIQDLLLSATTAQYPQAVLLSGTRLGVVYITVAGLVVLQTVNFGVSSATFNAPVTIGANANTTNPWLSVSNNGAFNFVSFAYSVGGTPNGIGTVSYSSAGSIISATFFSQSFTPTYLVNQVDALNNLWVYWVDSTTPASETIYYQIYTSALSGVSNGTVVSGLVSISNISPSNQINGHQFLYYSTNTNAPQTSTPNYVTTRYAEISTSSVVSTNNPFLTNVEIETKWATYQGINYAVFGTVAGNIEGRSDSTVTPQTNIGNQRTFFLISESTKNCVAKCFFGKAITGTTGSATLNGVLSSLFTFGATIQFGAPFTFYTEVINALGGLAQLRLTGLSQVSFDFNDFESYQSVLSGNTAILNGGIVQMYDGKSCVELGFNSYPENVVLTPSTTGGDILAGTYNYAAVYEWYDNAGNFHQSAPQKTLSITTTGSTSSVSVDIQTISITRKINSTSGISTNGITVALYRTTTNGIVFFKVGQTPNDPSVTKITLVDTIPDSQIDAIADPQLYTDGDVVENIAPPPSMVMMANQNRLWLVDSESPTNTIWYSKTYSPGNGISMSDLLQIVIDPKLGNITSLIGMDANTVVLKQNGPFIFTGDGADDTGQNSSITNPQIIPSDVGCLYSRGTVLTPDGVMFKTSKGIYLLGRGLSVEYFGADAEAFNSQNIESAIIVPNTSQVRMLTSSGSTLVYDYIFKQWGTFSNHLGYSATIWNGQYVYCRTDGSIFIENGTTFLDNATPYAPLIQIAWFKGSGIQGFQRIRDALLLGDHKSPVSGHGVQISAAYDYVESFSTPVGFALPISASAIAYQYREFFRRQKCNSFSVLIQEVTTGASGEFISFTDLSLNMGLKKGLNKVSAAQSVG